MILCRLLSHESEKPDRHMPRLVSFCLSVPAAACLLAVLSWIWKLANADLANLVDDKNFPPLPARTETQHSALHSRVSSFQSLYGSVARSLTPKIPPGFEPTYHGHPITPSSLRSTPSVSTPPRSHATPSGPVVPAVPLAPAVPLVPVAQRASTPKPKPVETSKDTAKDLGDADRSLKLAKPDEEKKKVPDPGLGSSIAKSVRQKAKGTKEEAAPKTEEQHEKVQEAKLPQEESSDSKGKGKRDVAKPNKIEIPSRIAAAAASASGAAGIAERVATTPMLDSAIVATPPEMSSRPATPLTGTSDVSRVSMPRPRTLRVTTSSSQKVEPTPASATTERSSGFPAIPGARMGSRRPSISSAQRSRPSTPATSERLLSYDVSRTNSPPPSIVGSAPERTKSRNQQKKDRREKAKKSAEQPTGAAATTAPAPPVAEEVAPVIARQKKQKKRVDNSVAEDPAPLKTPSEPSETQASDLQQRPKTLDSDATVTEAAKPQEKDKAAGPGKQSKSSNQKPGTLVPTAKEEPPKVEEAPKTPYTLRDLYNDAGKLPADTSSPVQRLLNEHVASMSKIISSLISSGDLSKDHPWLSPASFSSASYKLPPDSRRGQEYLDGNGYSSTDAFGYVYLPQKEKRALYAGNAVSVADSGERKTDLLRRCLITPNGWVLRHLSAEESEKLLELEERRAMYAEEFGDVGMMTGLGVLEQDDLTNLAGGIEELGRWGDRHGVCWVPGDERAAALEGYDDLDDEGLGGDGLSDDTDDLGINLDASVNMPGAWESSRTLAGGGPGTATVGHRQNSLLSMQGQGKNVNLRALDADTLQKRVQEKQKELEAARKELDKTEKAWTKKNKDIARWRENTLKV